MADSSPFVAAPAYSLLDRFPATPAGHVAFLEWVRDEVHFAAEAKRGQLEYEYSNATIESMVRGIKWAEAGQRVSTLSTLPCDAVEQVARVLRRELAAGTVERIDELLSPAVRALRDSWEDRDSKLGAATTLANNAKRAAGEGQFESAEATAPTKAKRSTERGEGRAKLIAALTKHHKYADGGCLNLEPIGNNKLARMAGVDQATASAFFKQEFKGHGKYKAACADPARLTAALKLLNGEFAPHHLYGSKPADEDERAEE